MKFVHWFVQSLLASPKFPGRDFLIDRIPKWFLKDPKGETIIKTRFGFKIKIDPTFDENIEKVIYERGVYELGTVHVIKTILEPGDLFIDVGANIGFLSMVAAKTVGKSGEVIAFEPVPSTFELLHENKELNQLDNLQINAYALGKEVGKGIIYEEMQNRGGASMTIKRSENPGISIEVKRLDDLVLSRRVDLIKIDVEGQELDVLKGGEALIRKDLPVLIVEYSASRKAEDGAEEMFQWLKSLEIYEFYRLKKGKERKSALIKIISKTGGLPDHDNIICLPKDKSVN